jgi:hypothetical protein
MAALADGEAVVAAEAVPADHDPVDPAGPEPPRGSRR